ncbi:MAG: FHA domain-containing protein [Rhodoglobus sp.]
MTVQFTPSATTDWLVVVGESRLIAIDPATDAATVTQARSAVEGPTGFQSVLDLMLKSGITTAPRFALLDWADGTLRAIVRGPASVVVSSAAGERSISGENVTTWAEQSFTGMTGFTLNVPGGTWASGAAHEAPTVRPLAKPKARPVVDIETTIVPVPESAPATPAGDGYDYLFGETVVRNVSEAAVRPPDEEVESTGDHDGHTVLTSDLAKLRGRRKPAAAASAAPVVVAKLSVLLPDGSAELLDQPILIGRAPSATQVPGGKLPRLVTIGGDDPDISRTHVRIVDEGGTVVVTDLHSRNGTLITLPGKSPQKLRDGEPTSVIPGTIIDLGGGITLAVREDA